MNVSRDEIAQLLESQGQRDQASHARQQLPGSGGHRRSGLRRDPFPVQASDWRTGRR